MQLIGFGVEKVLCAQDSVGATRSWLRLSKDYAPFSKPPTILSKQGNLLTSAEARLHQLEFDLTDDACNGKKPRAPQVTPKPTHARAPGS